ncbi:MAG: hypothetical protein H0T42_17600 [Deltaproteobacteria bacterium]|nr:hypothetical protein [Deltaproteobacteria bacterium]
MKLVLVCGLSAAVFGACDRKGAADNLTTRRPATFDAWMPAGAESAWQGTWATRLTLSLAAGDQPPREPIALDIHGDSATASDGPREYKLRFAVIAPCAVQLKQPITVGGNFNGGTAYHGAQFVMTGGTMRVGRGAAGYRKGKAAVVCSEGRNAGVHILDEHGVCTTWQDWFDRWESKPATCTWSQRDGHDVLTIGSGEWAPELIARGDVLESEQFTEYIADGYFRRR